MANVAHVSRVRSLYKRILVLHRFMPLDLRALGDQYVKDEFRRNKSTSPEEVKAFMTEWESRLWSGSGSSWQYEVRWYYDPEANSCAQFWYGGCQGNRNRFESEDLCKKACVKT